MKKILVAFLLVCLTLRPSSISEGTSRLSDMQVRTADYLAQMCIDNWEEYGVLPSVCISQAFIESTLGKNCSGNNLWGICSGRRQYGSLKEGVMDYLRVINNGYYKGAPHQKDYKVQLRKILDGGYCQPEGSYYSDALWSVEHYNFDKYDKKLFKKLEKRKRERELKAKLKKEKREQELRKQKQSKTFTIQYEDSVGVNTVKMNPNVVLKGSAVCMYSDFILRGIYDVEVSKNVPENTIIMSSLHPITNKNQDIANIVVYDDAKG